MAFEELITVTKFVIVNSLREFKIVITIPSVVIKITVQNCYCSDDHVWFLNDPQVRKKQYLSNSCCGYGILVAC